MKCARAISRDRRQSLDAFIFLNHASHAVDRPAGARGNVLVCKAAQRESANSTRWTSGGIARKCHCTGEPTLAMPDGSCHVSIAPTSFAIGLLLAVTSNGLLGFEHKRNDRRSGGVRRPVPLTACLSRVSPHELAAQAATVMRRGCAFAFFAIDISTTPLRPRAWI
jgi:hypothetical protein